MNRMLAILAMGILVAGCCTDFDPESLTKISPDGRNEITLYTKPLSYEVKRDGAVLVPRTEIGVTLNGTYCGGDVKMLGAIWNERKGVAEAPVYKHATLNLAQRGAFANFGGWGVELAARDDGVAYRFRVFDEKAKGVVSCERADVSLPATDVKCWGGRTKAFGVESAVPFSTTASRLDLAEAMVYLPFAFTHAGKWVAVTEADVHDYPIWNFGALSNGVLRSAFQGYPRKTHRVGGWGEQVLDRGGRWVRIDETEDYLAKLDGRRTLPWRVFVLADAPSKFCEADIVSALSTPPAKDADFSWVRPGKVAWDWWNCFDNGAGCNTATYRRFVDFAAEAGIEYVIMDEGWSESLDIWKFHPDVDVPQIIDYANKKGVGIILWMAWAQACGEEEKVAEHFAKLGAKGFKVDFMDRGDAEVANFLEKFSAACAKHRMVVDYHGSYRPVGLQRTYPNVLNFEGVHGLEQMKWFAGGAEREREMMFNDVAAFYLRLTAGPMDYTPGAMLNHAVGAGYKDNWSTTPGSVGTRARQMAMMALYEAPLQMLCDSPTNYERNRDCFDFMVKVPVVWQRTVGLAGSPDTVAAVARQANDGSWYAAALTTAEGRDYQLDTRFLGEGVWQAEIFRDAPESAKDGTRYLHERKSAKAGDKFVFPLAPGGGFIVRFTPRGIPEDTLQRF